VIISLGFELPRTSSDLPEDLGRASRLPTFRKKPTDVFLFGLASGDAYPAGDVTTTAVGSYPTVSPLPEPRRPGLNPVALAIGGLFSVVLVSDCSAWELPSALPMKSGLSSQSVTALSDHPAFSLAPDHYRTARLPFQELAAIYLLRPTTFPAVAPQALGAWSDRWPWLPASIFSGG
jgi:hypothetical protein